MLNFQRNTSYFLVLTLYFLLASCSIQKQIAKSANEDVLSNKALTAAHVGISIFDPAANKYLYNYQGDKYFVPASNTKLLTCYAAMKYLGDSLVGLKYKVQNADIIIQGTGDPTFLNSEFKNQPVFDFISKMASIGYVRFSGSNWQEEHLGSGWSWNDYNEYYMAERSPFPIYGNIVKFYIKENKLNSSPSSPDIHLLFPVHGFVAFPVDSITDEYIDVSRSLNGNFFHVSKSTNKFKDKQIPFSTYGYATSTGLLNDTLHPKTRIYWQPEELSSPFKLTTIHSQPTDSLLKPMMHRSDNFFAEQSLLMVSNEMLGVMNDEKIIDTLLKTDFK
ncbi:MAG: D-alanyl-D-alanine carboxypeptidase, partial [Bacteroidota bacterium]